MDVPLDAIMDTDLEPAVPSSLHELVEEESFLGTLAAVYDVIDDPLSASVFLARKAGKSVADIADSFGLNQRQVHRMGQKAADAISAASYGFQLPATRTPRKQAPSLPIHRYTCRDCGGPNYAAVPHPPRICDLCGSKLAGRVG